MYKMILWDFDGTLAYTGKDVWNSVVYAAQKCGGNISADFCSDDSNLGRPLEEIFREVFPYPGDDRFPEFDELIRIHYRQLSEYRDTYLYPGIEELLQSMKRRDAVNVIVTMKPQEALLNILQKKNWEGLFEQWLSPDSFFGREKTKSELIAHVLKETGYDKSACVYIGDTWSDVAAARENQIDCIGVTYGDGDTGRLEEMHPKYLVNEVTEIKIILEEGVK